MNRATTLAEERLIGLVAEAGSATLFIAPMFTNAAATVSPVPTRSARKTP